MKEKIKLFFFKLLSSFEQSLKLRPSVVSLRDDYDLVKSLEGFSPFSYADTRGNITVGYGFNMDSVASHTAWQLCKIPVSFDDVYFKKIELPEVHARTLYDYFWTMSKNQARERADDLNIPWDTFSDMKKFILTDIAYNTGSVERWTKVFQVTDDEEVLFESRRKQREIDGRIAKIGHHFGVIKSLEHAISIGLAEAKYII